MLFSTPSCTTYPSTTFLPVVDDNHHHHSSDLSDSIENLNNEEPSLGLFSSNSNATQPLPIRSASSGVFRSTSPVEQLFSSPLSTSAESVYSIKSSASSRSSAEREAERAQRRQLLETSLIKLRQPNLPLRKHLLVYETIKQIQHDLDLLDDEDVFCSLMDSADAMDEDVLLTSSWHLAPPSTPSTFQLVDEPMDTNMENEDCLCPIADAALDWGRDKLAPLDPLDNDSMFGVFDSIHKPMLASKWASEHGTTCGTSSPSPIGAAAAWHSTNNNKASADGSSSFWSPLSLLSNSEDPLLGGGSPATWGGFELHHLFPSQLLMQA